MVYESIDQENEVTCHGAPVVLFFVFRKNNFTPNFNIWGEISNSELIGAWSCKSRAKYEKQQENVASRVIFREASQETKNKCYFSKTTRMRQVIPPESWTLCDVISTLEYMYSLSSWFNMLMFVYLLNFIVMSQSYYCKVFTFPCRLD